MKHSLLAAVVEIERMRDALLARGFTVDSKPVAYALKVYL